MSRTRTKRGRKKNSLTKWNNQANSYSVNQTNCPLVKQAIRKKEQSNKHSLPQSDRQKNNQAYKYWLSWTSSHSLEQSNKQSFSQSITAKNSTKTVKQTHKCRIKLSNNKIKNDKRTYTGENTDTQRNEKRHKQADKRKNSHSPSQPKSQTVKQMAIHSSHSQAVKQSPTQVN